MLAQLAAAEWARDPRIAAVPADAAGDPEMALYEWFVRAGYLPASPAPDPERNDGR